MNEGNVVSVRNEAAHKIFRNAFIILLYVVSVVSAILILFKGIFLIPTPGGTFSEAKKEGQECTINVKAYSNVIGYNKAINGMSFYLLKDENGSFRVAYISDGIYENICRESPDDFIITGVTSKFSADVKKIAAAALNTLYSSDSFNENNVHEVVGDYYITTGSKTKFRTIFGSALLAIIALASLSCVIITSKIRKYPTTFEDDFKKGKSETVKFLLIAALASIGFNIGWMRLILLYFVATGTMRKYAEPSKAVNRFVFWITYAFFAVGCIVSNLFFNYVNLMSELCYTYAVPFTSTVTPYFTNKKILIGLVFALGVGLLALWVAISIFYPTTDSVLPEMFPKKYSVSQYANTVNSEEAQETEEKVNSDDSSDSETKEN